MASSVKHLGERQLAISPGTKNYWAGAGGTNEHFGTGLHDHSLYHPRNDQVGLLVKISGYKADMHTAASYGMRL